MEVSGTWFFERLLSFINSLGDVQLPCDAFVGVYPGNVWNAHKLQKVTLGFALFGFWGSILEVPEQGR